MMINEQLFCLSQQMFKFAFVLHSKMAKLEELEEVDLSGNMLKTVPTTIMNCRRMHTLIAHSNSIEVFPEVMQLMEMKVRAAAAAHVHQRCYA